MTDEVGMRPAHKPIRLRNRTCIYCGVEFGDAICGTDEHVIARRFVPKGTLDRQWNLIARACETCNHEKSQLEDDIAAVSMQPDVFGRFACDDPRLVAEARRKAQNSFSRRTRRPVRDSVETFMMTAPFGLGTATFNIITSPQVDMERLEQLAWYHVRAFFYLITYNKDTQAGSPLPGVFAPLTDARRWDWGNALMRGFMSATRFWHHRILDLLRKSADGRDRRGAPRVPGHRGWKPAWRLRMPATMRMVAW